MKKVVVVLTLAICITASLLLLCSCVSYTNVSNDVKGHMQQTFTLESGKSYKFDFDDLFQHSGLQISKYEISSGSNYRVLGNRIIARGTGISEITVTLYAPVERTKYVCSLGTLYTYDRKDFTPISNADELMNARDRNGYYIQTADIDLSTIANWQPIGNFPAQNSFKGMFINPDGYKISNLNISSADEVFHGPYGGCLGGLFGSIDDSLLLGLKLENVNIDVSDFDKNDISYAGGVVGTSSNSLIYDCHVSGNIKAHGSAGGIAGSVSAGCVKNCTFNGNATTTIGLYPNDREVYNLGAGGIAGHCSFPFIRIGINRYGMENCSASGNVSAIINAGGIAGAILGAECVKDSTFSGQVSGEQAGNDFGYLDMWGLEKIETEE